MRVSDRVARLHLKTLRRQLGGDFGNSVPYESWPNGPAVTSDGRQIIAVSSYAAPPGDGRPLLPFSLAATSDATRKVPVSFYPNSTLITSDGRPVYAVLDSSPATSAMSPVNPETATNLTDAAAASFTATYPTDSVRIVLSNTARLFAFATKNTVSNTTRFTLTQTVVSATTTNGGLGFSLFDGVNRTTVYYAGIGRLIVSGTASSTGNLATTLPTLVTGDVLTWTVISLATGELYFGVSKNGGAPYVFSLTGTVQGAFSNTMVTNSGALTALFTGSFTTYSSFAASSLPSQFGGPLVGDVLARPTEVGALLPAEFKVARSGSAFSTNVRLQAPLNTNDLTVWTLYVDIATGDDNNPGTAALPLKSINTAASRFFGGKGILMVKGGLYDQANAWNSAVCSANPIQIVSWDGQPIISSMHDANLTWTLGTNNTYSATFAQGVVNVFDALPANLTLQGDYRRLTLATSQANCESTPGTYFVTGTTIYVHAIDGRAPDSFIRVYKKAGSGTGNDYNLYYTVRNGLFYMENIRAEGGVYPFYTRIDNAAYTQSIYHKGCSFLYAGANNMAINGDALVVGQRSRAAWATLDGFNYHSIFSSRGPQFIEVDCIGQYNGNDNSDANNGSTSHEQSCGVRVNGDYRFNQDRDVIDVGTGVSWNVACVAGNSTTVNSAFCAGNVGGDTIKMYLDHCTAFGGLDLETVGSAVIYTSNFNASGSNVAAANVQSYTPQLAN